MKYGSQLIRVMPAIAKTVRVGLFALKQLFHVSLTVNHRDNDQRPFIDSAYDKVGKDSPKAVPLA
jgi:hypothetical protein